MNFGLAAHRLHRHGPNSSLLRWAQACEPGLQALGLRLHATGGAYNALNNHKLLSDRLTAVGHGRDGGLMRLVSRMAGGLQPQDALEGVFFLIDPVDPTSIYPEALALKRQCVIHGKPFVSTLAGAMEWVAVELANAGLTTPGVPGVATLFALEKQVAALIAHDALKDTMEAFAAEHFDTLSRFAGRVATGTTGRRLNALAWSRGWPADQPWVTCYQSGPLGGDAQIAELVLDQRCDKVIFFEDPHVARQHEADIQLMERAVCSTQHATTCYNTPAMARQWAQAAALVR
ncbi:methylglyoxal synthase [Rhodoferax sp. AJA081-3]|uniref:methylglyoxal synthase n=1 Tax=Rhodoferax sp. AJA081-3 TaxID=2752316 RepID=UPI001ADFB88A|nr:methylglyoxal synthase [Rhodoferax sp. AJA081-3]QTN27249.1 methylglyoxal synthase [Rhodoferax sp. AJA081-3]